MPLVGVSLEFGADRSALALLALVVEVDDLFHGDEVDDAFELILEADWELQWDGVCAEAVLDHVEAAPEVGTGAVKLVDEAEAWDGVAVSLTPDGFGLWLYAGNAVEDDDRAVEDAERALHLNGEVHVPGRIDDVDDVILPGAGRGGSGNGDAALLLLLHPVHRCGALVDLADLVDLLGVEEDALGDRGLTGVNVRNDADVSRSKERRCSCHLSPLEPEVAEGLVRLRHLVGLFTSLDCGAKVVRCIEELSGELVRHALAVALACSLYQPAYAEAQAALTANLHWYLVGGATNAARLHFD